MKHIKDFTGFVEKCSLQDYSHYIAKCLEDEEFKGSRFVDRNPPRQPRRRRLEPEEMAPDAEFDDMWISSYCSNHVKEDTRFDNEDYIVSDSHVQEESQGESPSNKVKFVFESTSKKEDPIL